MTRKNIRIKVRERDQPDMQRLRRLLAAQARTANRANQPTKSKPSGGQL